MQLRLSPSNYHAKFHSFSPSLMELSRLDFRCCGITSTSASSSDSWTSFSSSPSSSSLAIGASSKYLVHTGSTLKNLAFKVFLFLPWLENVSPFPLFSTQQRQPVFGGARSESRAPLCQMILAVAHRCGARRRVGTGHRTSEKRLGRTYEGSLSQERRRRPPTWKGRTRCASWEEALPSSTVDEAAAEDRVPTGTLFLPWNQADLIFGKSGQPFFWPLYFKVGPGF